MAPLLVGCAALAARDDDRYAVEMTDRLQLAPATLQVPVGSTVVWKATGLQTHTATAVSEQIPEGAEPWDSGALNTGQTWVHRFDTPGTHLYFCRYHHESGMVGTITVTE